MDGMDRSPLFLKKKRLSHHVAWEEGVEQTAVDMDAQVPDLCATSAPFFTSLLLTSFTSS